MSTVRLRDGRVRDDEQQRLDLLNADYDGLRRAQGGKPVWLISQVEGGRLWDATLTAFVQGNWVAAVLTAQATCERGLAALLYSLFMQSTPPTGWERWGLGSLVRFCRKEELVNDALLDEVEVLCEERKPYGRWRGPLAEGSLMKVVRDALDQGDRAAPDAIIERHLAALAYRSTLTAMRVHFGDLIDPPTSTNATPSGNAAHRLPRRRSTPPS